MEEPLNSPLDLGTANPSDTVSNSSNNPRDQAYFHAIEARDYGNDAPSVVTPTDDHEDLTIWFSRVPKQERVIAVQRDKSFYKAPPTVASLKQSILAKYPGDLSCYSTDENSVDLIFGRFFDLNGRIMSPSTARKKGLLYLGERCAFSDGGFPGDRDRGPVGLGIVIKRAENKEIASRFLAYFV